MKPYQYDSICVMRQESRIWFFGNYNIQHIIDISYHNQSIEKWIASHPLWDFRDFTSIFIAQLQQLMQICRIRHLLHRRFQFQLSLVQVTLLERFSEAGENGGRTRKRIFCFWIFRQKLDFDWNFPFSPKQHVERFVEIVDFTRIGSLEIVSWVCQQNLGLSTGEMMLQKKKGNVTSQNLGHCSHEMWRFTSGITRGVLENSPFSSMVFSINQYVRMCLPYFPIILPLKKKHISSVIFHCLPPCTGLRSSNPPQQPPGDVLPEGLGQQKPALFEVRLQAGDSERIFLQWLRNPIGIGKLRTCQLRTVLKKDCVCFPTCFLYID